MMMMMMMMMMIMINAADSLAGNHGKITLDP